MEEEMIALLSCHRRYIICFCIATLASVVSLYKKALLYLHQLRTMLPKYG
jgi:hypothetical protein